MMDPPTMFPIVTGRRLPTKKLSHVSVGKSAGVLPIDIQELGVDLEYQGFSAELAALPSPYEPARGALLIAQIGGEPAGCVALRQLDVISGEMKRLYVRTSFRGLGVAECLIAAVVEAARRAGYAQLKLDTLPSMTSAQALYRKLGFATIPAYGEGHLPGTRFYSLAL